MTIEDTVANVKRVAQSHCPRCGDGLITQMAARAGTPHTCHDDVAAALAFGHAVLDDAYGLAHGQGGTEAHWEEVAARIDALGGKGKE